MAMTPQALNATLQRQAESRQQQEALAQRERESTAQALQQEKTRIEAERTQKLKSKEDELGARFQKEMDAAAQELAGLSDSYAKKWMDDRMKEMQKPVVLPEQEKQRREIVDLSSQMIQEVRTAVNKVAGQEKIDIVWLKQAVRKPVKDITDTVAREITNGK